MMSSMISYLQNLGSSSLRFLLLVYVLSYSMLRYEALRYPMLYKNYATLCCLPCIRIQRISFVLLGCLLLESTRASEWLVISLLLEVHTSSEYLKEKKVSEQVFPSLAQQLHSR